MLTLPPGSKIGIIGGGQLGKMIAGAAANLGYRTHIYTPESDSPASFVSDHCTIASYLDQEALLRFAKSVDIVTLEFENIPYESMKLLGAEASICPGWKVLYIAQNRLREKNFVTSLGIGTAAFMPVNQTEDLKQAVRELGLPAMLKTTEQGYDGKGQYVLKTEEDVQQAASSLRFGTEFVLEKFVDFTKELSVIVARNAAGECMNFPVAENIHHHGILHSSSVPACLEDSIIEKANQIGQKIATNLNLVGILAIEFFLTKDGELLVNEMAPRPHNSGHWSLDVCLTSQFEQLVRAVCGLPFGSTLLHSKAVMYNIIGEQAYNWASYAQDSNTKLYLYGKEVRPGRKMGHYTVIDATHLT